MKNHATTFVMMLVVLVIFPGCAGVSPVPREKVEGKTVVKQDVPESARAIEHYLRARLAELSGNYQQATYEMRKALLYDSSCLLHTELGRYYAMQGLWKQAVQQANRALDACKEYVPALILKGMLLVTGNEREKAAEYFSRAVESDPKNIEAAIRLAQVYLDLGKKDAARKVLERMTRDNPDSAEGFRRLGDLAFESGDEAAAERYYRRVLQLAPSDTRTIEVLAGLLERQGRYREAIAVFEDALVYSPENPSYMAYMGGLYLKAGDRESADAYFDQLRAMDPRNARLVAYEYSRLNMHKKAIAELVNLLEKNPNMHSERLLLAIILEERKQWDKALEQLDRIPQTSRVYINALVNRGWCLLNMKRYAEAADVLEKALEAAARDEDRGRAWRYLAMAWAKLGKFDYGLRRLDEAIGKNPKMTDLVEAKANLLVEAGRGEEALRILDDAVKKNPKSVSLLYALGATYERLGKIDESIRTMERLLEIDPYNASALNFIGYTLADQNRQLERAERLIRRALLLEPGSGAITDSLGWVLYRKGKYQQALELLRKADEISPKEPVIIMHIGDALLKLGKRAEAIRQYRRALECDPEPRDRKQILERLEALGQSTDDGQPGK